jgi:hypothetical protein
MLAAIRTWALDRRPRLERALPAWAPAGAPVLLTGHGLGDGPLEARFGATSTWALALSDELAVAVVPSDAGSPLTLFRRALASNALPFRPSDSEGPTRVVRVDPGDGSLGAFRDSPLVVRFSRPLDARSVTQGRIEVRDPEAALVGQTRLSPDGRVLLWLAERRLRPVTGHTLRVDGLRDERGEPVETWASTFATGRLTREDFA